MRGVSLFIVGWLSLAAAQAAAPAPSAAELEFLARLTAVRPFLDDSADVRDEPQSIGRFFTPEIYARLAGNAYYGYQYDEGFHWQGTDIALEPVTTVPGTEAYGAPLRHALAESLAGQGLRVASAAPVHLRIGLVGVEARHAPHTLPGVMLELVFTNADTGRSFFWRLGVGSRHSLAAALVTAADIVVALLLARRSP